MNANDYSQMLSKLPKPVTAEEQYLYSLVFSAAGLPHTEPFQSPFWRLEQYWKAFYEVMSDRYTNIVPSANTVTTETIVDKSVTEPKLADEVKEKFVQPNGIGTSHLKDYAVTYAKLANDVTSKLLGNNSVEENMLSTSIENRLLGEGRVTELMLEAALANKLLGTGRVTKEMLSSDIQAKLDKIV